MWVVFGGGTMMHLDLRPFGFQRDVELHGTVEATWAGGKRLVFLFGENHSDREMKRLNVLNACNLVDSDVVGCAGTEVPVTVLDERTAEIIEARSRELFQEHKTDGAVIDLLSRAYREFGFFEFGGTLKILRPSLPVRCVENLDLRDRMKPISDAYGSANLGMAPHPFPEHPNLIDHPLNREREGAMVDNLLALWDSTAPALAAILNVGLEHVHHIAVSLRERGINYMHISIAASPPSF